MIGTAITAPSNMRIVVIPAKSREEIRQAERLLRVAAYCRVSTDQEEQESSYEAQIGYYTEKINSNSEWQMAGIFADEGITGTQAKKRPEFLKMIRLCRQGKIDMILTKSLSRFARNTVDSLKYIRDLKALGIAIVFEKENINTLETDTEMMLTIMSCFAQAESESISKNVSWGVRQSFKSGNVPMQYKKLLGYKKGENDLPEIIPEEAEIVKDIFRSYLDGMSLKQIADSLNSRGIKTKHKQTVWQTEVVKSILVNEKYTGDALLQKTYITDCITKKSRKNNGELPMYLVKNHHEPIISRADFNRVQEEMARRGAKKAIANKLGKTEQGKYSAKYALSELLICGECGSHYRRVTWTAKGFKEIKWRCINRIQYGKKKCHSSPTVDEQALHKAIVSAINEFCEVKPYKLFVYLLVTPDLENAAYRVEKLKQLKGINLYAQAERNVRMGIVPNKEQLEFAQRYVYSGKYRSETWQEYCQRNNESRALTIKPIILKAANDFVKQFHCHNLPTVGCKFAVACYKAETLCGVAICGRPTARNADDGKTVEIYRNCTDGTYNACSKLYGACVKVSKDMGYERVITYILDSENGASVLASNFTFDGKAGLPEQTGSRQKCRAVAPKEYKKRYVYNIVPPDNKEEKSMGRLTADPEFHQTEKYKASRFTLAVPRDYKNKDTGEYETDFIRITAWGGLADFVCSYFKKGSPIAVSGNLRTRKYLDKDGNKRTATEVVAEHVYFAGSNKASSDVPPTAADEQLPEPPEGYEEYADGIREALDGEGDYPFET